jgi:excisionase family DNA binding protein
MATTIPFPQAGVKSDTFAGLVRIRQAAQYLGLSEWSIRKMAHEGELRFVQRTSRSPMLFDPGDLNAWVQRNKR